MSDVALVPPAPLPHDSDVSSSEQISINKAENLIKRKSLDTSGKEQLTQLLLPRRGLDLKSILKIALVVVLATSYLTFCFIVHHVTIPIEGNGLTVLGPSFIHFSTESGITTISILIISVALWPIRGLVDEIRSEEFFRLLCGHADGVPLNSANAISTPITGLFDIILATIRRHCSGLLTSTLAITLAIIATSSLAPSALNTASVTIDVNDLNFTIGAVPESSFINENGYSLNTIDLFSAASTMSWVEIGLNLTNAYHHVASSEGDPFEYIVPFPPGYTTTMKAYWTTDVIVLNSSCNWQTAEITGRNLTDLTWNVTLSQANLYLTLDNTPFVSTENGAIASVADPFNNSIPISDGSAVFVLSQFQSNYLDLGNVPRLQFPNGYYLAFLVCSPRASLRTYEVRTNGNGIIDLGQRQQTQENLDLDQVNYLLSWVLMDFATYSGPNFANGNWTEMMAELIFGKDELSRNGRPAPLANTTAVYNQVIQSAMKTLLSGIIDTANVTGGFTMERVVLKSSLGHVMTSTILFVLLTLALVVAQFRTGQEKFTFIDVAAALDNSEVPKMCGEMKQLAGVGDRKILTLVRNDNGGLNILASNAPHS